MQPLWLEKTKLMSLRILALCLLNFCSPPLHTFVGCPKTYSVFQLCNRSRALPKAKVASVSTFEGCLDILDECAPWIAIFENVQSIDREVEEELLFG